MRVRAPLLFVAVAAMLGSTGYSAAASADSPNTLLNDTIAVSLGTFVLSTDTQVSLNGSGGSDGSQVDLKRDLGFKDTNRFRLDGTWRFAKRHKLRLLYFSTNQHADATINRALTIGNTTYPIDAQLHSEHSFDVAELAYEYAFWRGENFEVTGSVGVHTIRFTLDVSGTGSVNGMPGQFRTESASTTAPLPVVGIRGLWQFEPQWYLDTQAQYFAVNVNDIDGHVSDLRAGVTRMFGAHFGVGAGWNQFITRIDVSRASFDGALRWRYSGALIYITGSF